MTRNALLMILGIIAFAAALVTLTVGTNPFTPDPPAQHAPKS